jgi:hypothetical protein
VAWSNSSLTGIVCVFSPVVIFADKENKRLIIHSSDSSFLANIPLSSEPFDIAIVDPQIVVVTYGRDRFIEFINLETKVANKIPLNGNCWGRYSL